MKKHLLLPVILCFLAFIAIAQPATTGNYVVANNNNASLVTMTGSEQLIGINRNSTTSFVESLSFDFWFMGVRYNNFTVNSNGLLRFGTSGISSSQTGNGFPLTAANGAILAPFAGDIRTSGTGKIHSLVTGNAPNRKCIIEFLNMGLGAGSITANGTFQVILNETTGIIQYIYGGMTIASTPGVSGTESVVIGLSSDNVNTKTLSLNHGSFASNTTIPATKNNYTTTGNIGSLNSAANGSRREIKFTPPILVAPLSATISAPTTSSITLSWIGLGVIGEQGFVIYKSDDGGVTYDFALQTIADATSAVVPNLLAATNYMFKVYSVSEGALSTSSNANGTTTGCGAGAINILNITGSGPFTWSALAASWTLAHVPTSCEDAIINYNGTTASDEQIAFNLDVDVAVKSLTVNNISTSARQKVFNISGYGSVAIAGDLILTSPGGNKFNRCAYSAQNKTTVNGNVTLSRPSGSHTVNEGQSAVGSNGNLREQVYLLRGNMTFNKRGYTTDEHTNFTFDKAGTQYIYNHTTPQPFPYVQGIGDTLQAVLFEKLVIGNANATTLVFAGTSFDGYMETQSREGVIIGTNSTLDLPQNYSINSLGGSSYFKMFSGSKLRLGGDQTLSPNGIIYGVTGSNFPGSFSPYTFDPTSTIEYYGSNAITQTIFNGITYSNLVASNGSGSGRAQKITTAPIVVNTSFNINALADVTLGLLGSSAQTVSSVGPLNINATGGLYCNANVVSGAGTFTMGNGSFLGMGHAQGISLLGNATGNIQMTGARNFNTTGNYIYNGLVTQVTGGGLPTLINDLTIDNPTTVTIASNQTVNGVDLLKQGTFDIGITKITHNGVSILNSVTGKMKADFGTVEMKGTTGIAQNLSGNWFLNKTISSLINANSKGITVAPVPADTLLISTEMYYGPVTNSAITTNDNLTLLSRSTATARFGEIVTASGNTITGKVNIERYLFARKSWRLLAAPVANGTSPFVTASWREAASLASTGYGTQITGPYGAAAGMDAFSQRASMKSWNPATNLYVDVTNTNTTNISNAQGYYVFVRGDRAVPVTGAAAATNLRIKGDILTGNQIFNVPAGKFQTFGNPYPSRIDFRTVTKSSVNGSFITWNPNSPGSYNVGAFETYTFDGTNYLKLPGGTIRNFIESGEAVFVQSNAGAGIVTVKESDKVGGSAAVSRSSTESRAGVTAPTLEINMYSRDVDGSTFLADGILINFNDSYSTGIDNMDVRKISNTADNLAIKNGNFILVAERRPNIRITDTIKMNLANTHNGPYRFEIDPSVLNYPDVEAILNDKFLSTKVPVSLNAITNYTFDITADAASKVADRFMITFKQVPPMRFTSITALRNADNTATVKWNTENENNINYYTIEHSVDAVNFSTVTQQLPTANNFGNPYYNFLHAGAVAGNNWYRVKSNAINGSVQYTSIVKLGPVAFVEKPSITIYPNPATKGTVNIYFTKKPTGTYQLKITNKLGQILHVETIQIQSTNLQKTIKFNAAVGSYDVIIIEGNNKTYRIPFLFK